MNEILWCDHSNESSLPVLSHDTIFFLKILENEIWKFGRNLPLAMFGSERVNLIIRQWRHEVVEMSCYFA